MKYFDSTGPPYGLTFLSIPCKAPIRGSFGAMIFRATGATNYFNFAGASPAA